MKKAEFAAFDGGSPWSSLTGSCVVATADYFKGNNFADNNEGAPSSSLNFFKALHISGFWKNLAKELLLITFSRMSGLK